MKFDICVKNIKNMKLQLNFQNSHQYIYKYIYEKFEEFFSKLIWRETLFLIFEFGVILIWVTKHDAKLELAKYIYIYIYMFQKMLV